MLRDDNGEALANKAVSVLFTILENGTTTVFQEIHKPITNNNGIIVLNIGEGSLISGDFNTIDWGSNPHFLKTEIDSGDGLTDMGTTEFKVVPYSLHAETANLAINDEVNDADADPVNELLSGAVLYGTKLEITDAGGTQVVDLSSLDEGSLGLNQILNNDNSAGRTLITDLPIPRRPDNAATKGYVDALEAKIRVLELALIESGLATIMDIDGNSYRAVIIGNQIWMAEDLRTTTFKDGIPITYTEDDFSSHEPQYSWYDGLYYPEPNPYPQEPIPYHPDYGALYNIHAVNSEKLCPVGWRVPSIEDWMELEIYLGMDPNEAQNTGSDRGYEEGVGIKMKEPYYRDGHWEIGPNSGTNESGFTALPGGRVYSGNYEGLTHSGYWWTTMRFDRENYYRGLHYNAAGVEFEEADLHTYMSVRCIKGTNSSGCEDRDGDGYGVGQGCYGFDCDDTNPDINPGMYEILDHLDNDCDGLVDEGLEPKTK